MILSPALSRAVSLAPPPERSGADAAAAARSPRGRKSHGRSWARLPARIYEVDLLICPHCGRELKIVAVVTDPVVIDKILAHRERVGLRGPFDPRAPPVA